MSFYIPGTQTISNSNNLVGINTLNPNYTLDVNGNINFTNQLYKNNSIFNGLTGKLLRVDSIYGNNTEAALNPYQYPFSTINSAINYATTGDTIFLYPGTYEESITIPSAVSIRGASTQTTTIQKTGVTSSTTLVTLNPNCRIEDVTMTLTSNTDGIDLIGIKVENTSSITSKIRTCVLNVNHTSSGNTNLYGIYATGTSNTGSTSSNLIRATTINTTSLNGIGKTRGIFVGGSLRLVTRDTNIYATGLTNAGGCETLYPNSYLDLRISTISGSTFDISESTGNILIASSDLVNSNANSKSFTVSVSPNELFFGIIGNMGNDTTYYLVPGTLPIASLSTSTPYEIPVIRNTLFFKISINCSSEIPGSITFTIYKNGVATDLTLTLTTGQTNASLNTISVLFNTTDKYDARVTTVGNPGSGTFTASVLIY